MNRYAYLMGGSAFFVSDADKSPGPGWLEVPASVECGARLIDGEWFKPGTAPADVKARCLEELAASDVRVTRALEDGDAVPNELKQYRATLRQIYQSGVAPDDWPVAPQYAQKG